MVDDIRQRRISQNVERGTRINRSMSYPFRGQEREARRRGLLIWMPQWDDPEVRRTREALNRRLSQGNFDRAARTIEASEAQANVDRQLNQRRERIQIQQLEAEEFRELINTVIHPSGRARRGRDY